MQHAIPPLVDAVQDARIARRIDDFARLSDPGPGVTRLAYSALEREAHRLFISEMSALGLTVHTDAAGNTIAELAGDDPATPVPAIGTGSHLDSVPQGGRFDGIAGVVAAMEVAQVMVEGGIAHQRPWRFVAFAAEEGARFGQACNGSRIVAGLTSAADVRTLSDADGVTMAEAMTAVGLDVERLADARWRPEDWHAFVELHIEQGGVLEESGAPVGVVDTISGSTRLLVTIEGQASHTGGTPMHLRRDALVTASRCVLACDELARDPHHHGTRITVGTMQVRPGSITTIPGEVTFSIDVRDIDNDRQRRTADALVAEISRIAARADTPAQIALLGDTSPVVLPSWVAAHTLAAAGEGEVEYRILPSGASHDSQQINRVTPTGMIFVPSRGGVSHVPEEFTDIGELAVGTRVLLSTLLRLDADDER
ncbi:Zn-dependent hydrolase [Leifsonia poae]|uniref:Zn-dependent hydrolase n=1 Tax=Leifsonia poae TaxID=110933 RepID=UPI001CBC5261|nr:Zn-dependent hydrolase [Leifsonia poae]